MSDLLTSRGGKSGCLPRRDSTPALDIASSWQTNTHFTGTYGVEQKQPARVSGRWVAIGNAEHGDHGLVIIEFAAFVWINILSRQFSGSGHGEQSVLCVLSCANDLRPKLIPGEGCVPLSNGVTPAPQEGALANHQRRGLRTVVAGHSRPQKPLYCRAATGD